MRKLQSFFLMFLWIILFGSFSATFSQEVIFCESVDDNGNPNNASTVFTIPQKGGYLDVLVKGIKDTKHVAYIISFNNQYDNTITQNTEVNWDWCWKEITFYDPGNYLIKVYDDKNSFVASGNVRIKYKD